MQTLIADLLTMAGFQVVTASTGWDALKILEDDGFDLLVADIVLPGDLSGLELVTYVRARQPALKALFVSGYSAPVEDDPDLDDFVAKPFRPRELLGCVYELLGRQPPEKQAPAPHRDALLSVVEAKILCARHQSAGSSSDAAAAPAGKIEAAADRGSVLVVDDDPAVLEVAAMMIEDLGYTVLRAVDGVEALRLLGQHSQIILLVTDVVMPGMDGWELARLAKQQCPDLKILYMSGFIKNRALLPREEYGPVLPKPWRSEQFFAAVKRALENDGLPR